jgi:hypothetical protein
MLAFTHPKRKSPYRFNGTPMPHFLFTQSGIPSEEGIAVCQKVDVMGVIHVSPCIRIT